MNFEITHNKVHLNLRNVPWIRKLVIVTSWPGWKSLNGLSAEGPQAKVSAFMWFGDPDFGPLL